MKKLTVLLLLVFVAGCTHFPKFRDELDPDEKLIMYIDQHAKSKNDAFVLAHAWIAKNFNSANDVIQMQDKEAGMIVVKALYPFSFLVDKFDEKHLTGYVTYTMSVQTKDQKVKFEFVTGTFIGPQNHDWGYLPRENMPELLLHYSEIHDDLLQEIFKGKVDF